MIIKKDDTVVVITGKDKGKVGKVIKAIPATNKVIVEKVNVQTKHQKPTQKMQQGGIMHVEGPIDASNVMLWDKKTKKPTRVGTTRLKDGEKVRVSRKTGEVLD